MPSTTELVAVNLSYAGLGNRLRFTLSAKHVAEALGRKFSYVWPVGDGFGARLVDLWEAAGDSSIDVPDEVETSMSSDDWDLQQQRLFVRGSSVVSGPVEKDAWLSSLRSLQPAPAVQELISGCEDRLGSGVPYVGVQVRSSPKTHQKTLDHSPVEWFERRMAEMVTEDASTRFFVSADEPAVAERLTGMFPGSVSIAKTGGYNSYRALVESAADLHVLSRSRHILGPYWSSFAQTAWLMGGKSQPLEDSVRTAAAVSRSA